MTPAEAAGLLPRVAALPDRPLRVAALGGGTGLPRVLAGLGGGLVEPDGGREVEVTAIVTTADDGGSSGELRRGYGVPAPGDVRNCLVALASGASPLAALFQHRFGGEGALAGHTVGNVVLTALAQRLGDFGLAVEEAARLLGVRGRVVPAQDGAVELVAELSDGRIVRGEAALEAARGPAAPVARVRLSREADAPPEAIEAVLGADVVVLGPGSLYSSVIASALAAGLPEALRETAAVRVLVVNLFTQPGESDGHDAAAHVRAVRRHLGDVLDVALCHRGPAPAAVRAAYAARGQEPVPVDRAAIEAEGVVPVMADLLGQGPGVEPGRHDPAKLARALLALSRARRA
jgi:uncharacterized cofD-like protein